MANTKKKGIFYGWYIVAAGFFLLGFGICIVMNCAGLFIKPVTEDLGFTRKAFAMNNTLISLAMMAVSFSMGTILEHIDIKKVMCAASVGLPVFYFLYSRAHSIAMFYLLSLGVGAFLGLIGFVPVSILITTWFNEKRGLATGIAFTGSGVFGFLLSPLISRLIQTMGWRTTYAVLGIAMLAVMAPITFLVIRSRPKSMGLEPYGRSAAPDGNEWAHGLSFKEALRTVSFWSFALVVILCCMMACSYIQQISAYTSDLGYSASFAATMNSLVLGIMAVGKIVLGQLYDKKGTFFASLLGNFCLIGALLCLLFADSMPILLLSVAFSGLGLSFCSVPYPIVTRRLFGGRDYNKIYGVINAASSVGTAIGSPVAATFYDVTGSYKLFWLAGLCVVSACLALYVLAEKKAPSLSSTGPAPQKETV